MIFPKFWTNNSLVIRFKAIGDRGVGSGYKKNGAIGDYVIGVSLGPVFSTCSPTYLFIIATVLPASFFVGFTYLLGFVIGLVLSLLIVAYFGQTIVNKITKNSSRTELLKKIFGILILLVGLAIITGVDKKIETWILDSGYGATINFEQTLINKFDQEGNNENKKKVEISNRYLQSVFPDTDWSKVNPSVENALSGGPGKDGIPAIDNPKFKSISEYTYSNDVQAIVLQSNDEVKVYPYNILTWHEIVNDEIGDKKVAVTFCPLCGSALVFDRELKDGLTTFGVSGALIESNMVMFDRDTESLWQQSTGKSIAGSYLDTELEHVPFQLMSMGDIKNKYPLAIVLSEETGFARDYTQNPYAGYENTDTLIFDTSSKSNLFEMKEIMIVFKIDDQNFTTPMSQIKEGEVFSKNTDKGLIKILKNDGEITVSNNGGAKIPFYFEMWFSVFAQHKEDALVL